MDGPNHRIDILLGRSGYLNVGLQFGRQAKEGTLNRTVKVSGLRRNFVGLESSQKVPFCLIRAPPVTIHTAEQRPVCRSRVEKLAHYLTEWRKSAKKASIFLTTLSHREFGTRLL
jgi:hypothetical protein